MDNPFYSLFERLGRDARAETENNFLLGRVLAVDPVSVLVNGIELFEGGALDINKSLLKGEADTITIKAKGALINGSASEFSAETAEYTVKENRLAVGDRVFLVRYTLEKFLLLCKVG